MYKTGFRKLVPVVGAVAALLVGAPLASAAAPTSREAHQHTETINVVAKQTQTQSIDLGEKGKSLGDQLVIAEDLYRHGKKIGDHSVVCTYIHTEPDALQCLGTFALPEGQITGQALLHLPAPSAVDVAVTGGSGAFSNVGGYVRTVPAGTTERHVTFNLTR
ncbi:hypothetical protein [Streptomyces sp. NPDC007856]|uniref:allene oxide cyclase barrel-like domain-containing protein n=1 Tax=Streptomyces sp. NPDC007856 TaxID=3364781 RepID=UPI0036CCD026